MASTNRLASARIIVGDCRDALAKMESGSVQTCVTSPPYFGLRDYEHGDQMGLESTPDEYVAGLVAVFREVRRVLRNDGTLWLNLGDSYVTATSRSTPGLKPKDLIGAPWRVALALQADGWWLRSDIIWSKNNPFPESVTDRCTKSHEYVFLLSKNENYFYDNEAIKEQSVAQTEHDFTGKGRSGIPGQKDDTGNRPPASATFKRHGSKREQPMQGHLVGTHRPDREDTWPTGMRNKRDVWTIPTKGFSGAHFAVMPTALVEPCILAGSQEGDLVLDPFAGSGTVGVVALRHQRNFVGIELNPEYAQMAARRISDDMPLLNQVEIERPDSSRIMTEQKESISQPPDSELVAGQVSEPRGTY